VNHFSEKVLTSLLNLETASLFLFTARI